MAADFITRVSARLKDEQGTLFKQAPLRVALVYPSPYHVGMASLGYQVIYGILNALPNVVAERAFLPDEGTHPDGQARVQLLTYESATPVGNFDIVAFSVAYELELSGVFSCLRDSGIPILTKERRSSITRYPFVLGGGPLTFSNPVPMGPFFDAILMGEAEGLVEKIVSIVAERSVEMACKELETYPGVYVPEFHGEALLPVAKADDSRLPGRASIVTPHSALPNMFLVEPERGCSRGCSFCVMRRTTNGGMRKVAVDTLLATIPDYATRVGLVGAAVSDHPKIVEIVNQIVDSGREIGLSSLRADRLTPEFVASLKKGGYKTLTVASDGASERMRTSLEKKIYAKHLLRAAELCRDGKIPLLKIYMMVGVPGEGDDDLDELIDFSLQQAQRASPTKMALGIATFVAKRNTPLDNTPFVGIKEANRKLKKIRLGLKGKIDVRSTSSRWAWVEYVLAQGGFSAGLAAYRAWQHGSSFAAYKSAYKENEEITTKKQRGKAVLPIV